MRTPISLRFNGDVYRLKPMGKKSGFTLKSSRVYTSETPVGEPRVQIVIDAPGMDHKRVKALGYALGRSGYGQIWRPHAGFVSFDIPAHKAVTNLFSSFLWSSENGVRPVLIDSHRYELVPRQRGASDLPSRISTAEEALKSSAVLRFRYKRRGSDQYETVRAYVHGLYDGWQGMYFTASRYDPLQGMLRRAYALNRASDFLVERHGDLNLNLSLRLSIYESRAVTVDVEGLASS